MKVAGFCSGHDCAYAVLEDGIPVLHAELERYVRVKEPLGDAIQFFFDTYEDSESVEYFSHCVDPWEGGLETRYPESYHRMLGLAEKNGGKWVKQGHHEAHAANAFFSSNFNEALIITIDGGGVDVITGQEIVTAFTVWTGRENRISPVVVSNQQAFNPGSIWNTCVEKIFGLSAGHPKGNQAGSVMAMGVVGDPSKYIEYFSQFQMSPEKFKTADLNALREIAEKSVEEKFNNFIY